jgi:inosine-uridine nucleoside N-ribohydrolase
LRQVLANEPDYSVVIVVVGFSTNLARLLESSPDQHSTLDGHELVQSKCRFLSMMGGMFSSWGRRREFNIVQDVASAAKVFDGWPTPIVASGYEIGQAVQYPARSIERDFRYVTHHPLREAYMLYRSMPYDQETWDLTSALFAVRPDRGYFGLSKPGTIHIDEHGVTQFTPDLSGRHRYLLINDGQAIRVREAFEQLVSQPPTR